METKDAKELLKGRAAMGFLKVKGQDTILLAISFHSFHEMRNSKGLNDLLFNLIEKLCIALPYLAVLICGDFNEDITTSKRLEVILSKYTVKKYDNLYGVNCIDYIIFRNPSCKISVEAKNMVIPGRDVTQDISDQGKKEQYLKDRDKYLTGKISYKDYCMKVSNHSPLVANIEISV